MYFADDDGCWEEAMLVKNYGDTFTVTVAVNVGSLSILHQQDVIVHFRRYDRA